MTRFPRLSPRPLQLFLSTTWELLSPSSVGSISPRWSYSSLPPTSAHSSPRLGSAAARLVLPDFPSKDEEDRTAAGERSSTPTPQRRAFFFALAIRLCTITFVLFILSLAASAALLHIVPSSQQPIFILKLLAFASKEDVNTFSTRPEYCYPLLSPFHRPDLVASPSFSFASAASPLRPPPLSSINWAPTITGAEFLDQSYPSSSPSDLGFVKIIHQSWKTNVIPEKFTDWSDSWREKHPSSEGWIHVIWSDEDNLRLVEEFYSEWLELYLGFPTGIHRADFSRNLYMHRLVSAYFFFRIFAPKKAELVLTFSPRFGGVYADLDMISLLPTSTILSHLTSTSTSAPLFLGGHGPTPSTPTYETDSTAYIARMGPDPSFEHSIPNAWFASSRPGHPFWLLPIRFASLVEGEKREEPEWTTGPVGVWESERLWREWVDLSEGVEEQGEETVAADLLAEELGHEEKFGLVVVPSVSWGFFIPSS